MASLKEIKGRISSVKSTLKITSAMKLVASAKLRKAQSAIENMLPYQQKLQQMLAELLSVVGSADNRYTEEGKKEAKVALVVISSNSSLCGGFNTNVIKEALARIAELKKESRDIVVYSVGKKASDAMRKAGYPSPEDLNELVAHQSYEKSSALASHLVDAFLSGKYSKVEMVYTHFVSTSTQVVQRAQYLPMTMDSAAVVSVHAKSEEDFIIEPTAEEMLSSLLPRALALKVYTVILDSSAAEHAARTVAMQTATDNGENILQELTLEYNKGRQQKITAEILDLVGGSAQQ